MTVRSPGARMVELAYTAVSNTAARKGMRVQIPLRAQARSRTGVPPPGPRACEGRGDRVCTSSTGSGRARDQFGRSASTVPGTLGRSTTPSRSSRVAATSIAGLAPIRRWVASATPGTSRGSGPGTNRARRSHIAAGPIDPGPHAGQRRQVVRGHHGERLAGPLLGRRVLEPDEPGREDAGLVELLAEARLDGAEVLADDHRGRASALQGDELQQVAPREADVDPVSGAPPSGTQKSLDRPITWSMRSPPPRTIDARRRSASGR